MTKQGLVFAIASINVSKSKEGSILDSFWGEAVDGNKNRMAFRMGKAQVDNLMSQANVDTPSKLAGKKIAGNAIGYGKDKDGKELPGMFVINQYSDENGAIQNLNRETFVAGGLLQIVDEFNEWVHTKLNFSELERRCDTPKTERAAKPVAQPTMVEADAAA